MTYAASWQVQLVSAFYRQVAPFGQKRIQSRWNNIVQETGIKLEK